MECNIWIPIYGYFSHFFCLIIEMLKLEYLYRDSEIVNFRRGEKNNI